jgi:oligosaccharide repeat unit polymerase
VRGLSLIAYTGVILALVYYVLYGFRLTLAIPFIAILIMGVAQAARAGTFILLLMILAATFWRDIYEKKKNLFFSLLTRLGVVVLVILVIFIFGLMLREQNFQFSFDDSEKFRFFKIYAVGALSSFSVFFDGYDFGNDLTYGRYTFASLFQMLGWHQFESFGFYDEYLVISDNGDYTNIYTILRSLVEDFGLIFTILISLILGGVLDVIYNCAIRRKLEYLAIIIGIYGYILYSPLAPLTQHNSIVVSWILSPLILIFIKKCSFRKGV